MVTNGVTNNSNLL